MELLELKAELRKKTGRRFPRSFGEPINFPPSFTARSKSVVLTVVRKDIETLLRSEHGVNQPLKIVYGKGEATAMITDMRHDYLGRLLTHVDFKRVDLNKPVDINVMVVLTGEIHRSQGRGWYALLGDQGDRDLLFASGHSRPDRGGHLRSPTGHSLKVSDLSLDPSKFKGTHRSFRRDRPG